jgi:hypothetical protein
MNKGIKFITLVFAILMIAGTLVVSASAQTGGRVTVRRTITRPVVVRRYVSPYWGYRSYYGSPYWGYSSFYDPYWDSPYLRYQDQKFSLQRELAGNQRELAKHQAKYRADGYISEKERRELADDVRDVQRSRQRLNNFIRRNQGVNY